MTDVMEKLREGDIYRWRYREEGDDRQYGRYHCCSCIAIVDKHGRLHDTYWGQASEGRFFTEANLPQLELTRLGNLSELDRAEPYQADYYDDADIVDISHANSSRGNFYLRKGAKRSAAKMLMAARCRLERSENEERFAAARSAGLREAIASIEAGEIERIYLR